MLNYAEYIETVNHAHEVLQCAAQIENYIENVNNIKESLDAQKDKAIRDQLDEALFELDLDKKNLENIGQMTLDLVQMLL